MINLITNLTLWLSLLLLSGCCVFYTLKRKDYKELHIIRALLALFLFADAHIHLMLVVQWDQVLEGVIKIGSATTAAITALTFAFLTPRILRRPTALDLYQYQTPVLEHFDALVKRLDSGVSDSSRLDREIIRHIDAANEACARLKTLRGGH